MDDEATAHAIEPAQSLGFENLTFAVIVLGIGTVCGIAFMVGEIILEKCSADGRRLKKNQGEKERSYSYYS